MSTERRRLFFALWPDARVRDALVQLRDGIAELRRGRAVDADNLHLTIAFLGDTDETQRECAERAADLLHVSRFSLLLDRAGYWPRPHVFWVAASQLPQALASLVRDLNRRLSECGIEPDRREYRAHITLARRVPSGPRGTRTIEPIEWQTERLCLVESQLGGARACYRILRCWEFA